MLVGMTNEPTRRFELILTKNGHHSKIEVEGADVTRAVKGVQVTSVAGQPTLLALMPEAGMSGKIMGEGVVLEMTEGLSAVDFLNGVVPGELEQLVQQVWQNPETAHLPVMEAVLYVLQTLAVAEREPPAVESGS